MKRAVILLLAALLCIAGGCYSAYFDIGQWLNQRQLDQQGLLAEGQVQSMIVTSSSSRHAKNFVAKVRYTPADGKPMEVLLPISDPFYQAHSQPAAKVMVHYLHDHPEIAEAQGERRFPIGIIIGPVFVLIGLFLGLRSLLRLGRGF